MDSSVGIGLIIGLSIGMILYAANSEKFSQAQRVSIYVFIIFPPLQLLLFIIYLIYNSQKKEDEPLPIENSHRMQKETDVYDDRLNSLKELKESGILTVEEYKQKAKNIENSKLEAQLKESSNYKKLKSLYDDSVLTKEEFENKVEILKNSLLSKDEIEEELYFEGLRVFTDENLNYGFKDKKGDIIIKPIYEFAENFNEGLALIRQDGKFGFIDNVGNIIIDMKFDNAFSFDNGSAMVILNSKTYYINTNGDPLA